MSATATNEDIAIPSLHFSNSTSKAVGFGGSLMEAIQENAASIVGALQLTGSSVLIVAGTPMMQLMAAVGMTGKVIMTAYGNKYVQQRIAQQDKALARTKYSDGFTGSLAKSLHPKAYPIESSSALSIIANGLSVAYGVSQELSGAPGMTPIIVGALSMATYGNMLFGKEKDSHVDCDKQEPLLFAHSKSKALALVGKEVQMLIDNPIFTSSLAQIAITTTLVIGGIVEETPIFVASGAFYLAASLIQAAFVSKHDFSLDGTVEKAKEEQLINAIKNKPGFLQREFEHRQQPQLQLGRI